MGISTNAHLVYGYYLGDPCEEWEVENPPDWLTDDDDEFDIYTEVEDRLLAAAGFTETDYTVDGYGERRRAALNGVAIETFCSVEYPLYMLAVKVITAHRGDVVTVDPAELARRQNDYDRRLQHALTVLGLEPKAKQPTWMLVSYWG